VDKYFINTNTLMILPYENKSKVVEKYITYIINKTPMEIIDDSCKNYGSSFVGRCDSTYFLTGVKYKCPIIISETKEIIMFPTKSAKSNCCIWINFKAIDIFYTIDSSNVKIILINNQKYNINISSRIISNQIFKSSRLESVLKSKNR